VEHDRHESRLTHNEAGSRIIRRRETSSEMNLEQNVREEPSETLLTTKAGLRSNLVEDM